MSYTTFTIKEAIENCMKSFPDAVIVPSVHVLQSADHVYISSESFPDVLPDLLIRAVYKLYPDAVIGVTYYSGKLSLYTIPELMY